MRTGTIIYFLCEAYWLFISVMFLSLLVFFFPSYTEGNEKKMQRASANPLANQQADVFHLAF